MTYDVLIPWADWLPGHLAACVFSLTSQRLRVRDIAVGNTGSTPVPDIHPVDAWVPDAPRLGLWNRSAALNMAFAGAAKKRPQHADAILVVDADTVLLDDDVVDALWRAMFSSGHWHHAAWAICMEPSGQPRPHGMGGCILVRREAWEKVGGYDEAFSGWGYEDLDFVNRLKAAGYTIAEPLPAGRVLTLWHPKNHTPALVEAMEANKRLFASRYGKAAL